MARYSAFLGRAVELLYRTGDLRLPACGTFVADSGRSVFLEQHFQQNGRLINFRWEIPYHSIVRLEATDALAASASVSTLPADQTPAPAAQSLQVKAAHAGGGSSLVAIANSAETA